MGKRWALITGASSGIGAAFARQLAEAGWNLALVSNRQEENNRLARELEERYGVECQTLCLDLSQTTAGEELYRWAQGWHIAPEVVISNAGILQFGLLERIAPEALEQITTLHCTTPTLIARRFGADMAARKGGYILLVSSITAWMPYPTISTYAATKSYLKSLGQSLWYELRDRGVGVTTLFPSAVDTPLYNLDEGVRRRLRQLGLMLTPEEVARKGLKALFARRRHAIPGCAAKLIVLLCRLLPACALLPVMKLPAVRRIMYNEQ